MGFCAVQVKSEELLYLWNCEKFDGMNEPNHETWDKAMQSLLEKMSKRYFMLCEAALRRLVSRVIGSRCPSESEDMLTVLWGRGLTFTLMHPPHPANSYAIITRGEEIIDREEMPTQYGFFRGHKEAAEIRHRRLFTHLRMGRSGLWAVARQSG